MNLCELGKTYWAWRYGSPGWREVKSAYWSFRCGRSGNETRAAEQAFHRYKWWLYELKGYEAAREFMLEVVGPEPDEPL